MAYHVAYQIERLLNFALQKNLISKYDMIPSRNFLLNILGISEPMVLSPDEPISERLETASDIMNLILDYCVENGFIQDTLVERDLMDARIMAGLMPRTSEVIRVFFENYNKTPVEATHYLYNLSRDANYIQVERTAKNMLWKTPTEYGDLEITINLSKPEKDPKEIAKARTVSLTGYPKCLLCKENQGFAGNLNHPARQNLRLIPLSLAGDEWFLQYSPYLYYNEHCIVLGPAHKPMKLNESSFNRLFAFVEKFPHYFIGSNADLPIVGGSILSHDHFQGGRHNFPMENAANSYCFKHKDFEGISISIIKWPMSAIRIAMLSQEDDYNALITLALKILNTWKNYSDADADIINSTNGTPHNTVTPIVRINKNGCFEADLVLRNNRTTQTYPDGIFHPHANLHHIKKENIGLIEVMGLAVLPGRLKDELSEIANILSGKKQYHADEIRNKSHMLHVHSQWIMKLVQEKGVTHTTEDAIKILQNEVGNIFKLVLEDSGVFKYSEKGVEQFFEFMSACGFIKIT